MLQPDRPFFGNRDGRRTKRNDSYETAQAAERGTPIVGTARETGAVVFISLVRSTRRAAAAAKAKHNTTERQIHPSTMNAIVMTALTAGHVPPRRTPCPRPSRFAKHRNSTATPVRGFFHKNLSLKHKRRSESPSDESVVARQLPEFRQTCFRYASKYETVLSCHYASGSQCVRHVSDQIEQIRVRLHSRRLVDKV